MEDSVKFFFEILFPYRVK